MVCECLFKVPVNKLHDANDQIGVLQKLEVEIYLYIIRLFFLYHTTWSKAVAETFKNCSISDLLIEFHCENSWA